MAMRFAILSICVLACSCHAVTQLSDTDSVQQLSPTAKADSQGLLDAINQGIKATKAAAPSAAKKDEPEDASHKDKLVQSLHDKIASQSAKLAKSNPDTPKATTNAAAAKAPQNKPHAAAKDTQSKPQPTRTASEEHAPNPQAAEHNHHFEKALQSMSTHYCQTQVHKMRCDTVTQLSKHFKAGGQKSDAKGLDTFLSEVKSADCGALNGGSTFCKALDILIRHEQK